MNRDEVASAVAKRLGVGIGINSIDLWPLNMRHGMPRKVWDALIDSELELSKCGKDNCFGQEVEGCRRWVSAESLQAAELRIQELSEALRKAIKTASGRWCEWGSRAESVRDILEAALLSEEKPR